MSCLDRACGGLLFIVEQVLLNGEGARHWTDRMGSVSSETGSEQATRWRLVGEAPTGVPRSNRFEPQSERLIRILSSFSLATPSG